MFWINKVRGKFRARVTNGFLQAPKIEISEKAQKSLKNRCNCPWPFGHPRTRKIPLYPPFQRGMVTPPFGKWFGMLTILSVSKEACRRREVGRDLKKLFSN